MNRKEQIQKYIQENAIEEIKQLLSEITIEAKDRRKSKMICEEGIHEILIENLTYFIEHELQKEIAECIYQLIKRPTLISYFSIELSKKIVESSIYQYQFDILRSVTRNDEYCLALKDHLSDIIEIMKNVDYLTNQYACYSLSNLAKHFSDELIPIVIIIVDKMCQCDVKSVSEEHWFGVGEALCAIAKNVTEKIKLAGKIDYKLVELRDQHKENICLCNIIRDVIQFLAK